MKNELLMCFAFAVLLGLAIGVSEYMKEPAKKPQLYTVHFDGIEYQDLKLMWTASESKTYRTKTGKRMEFRGNFYEVEQ